MTSAISSTSAPRPSRVVLPQAGTGVEGVAVRRRYAEATLDEMTTTCNLDLDGVGVVDLSLDDRGHGQPFLLLHGGAGPQSALPFAERFAAGKEVRVITPTHPGFGGTTRPAGLDSIAKLAAPLSPPTRTER
jgi:pimeloyl-ACP methyl ester carboxylesterase